MKRLRTQESDKFMRFFSIVQNAARNQGYAFFLYAGDGREFETLTMEGEDLMGWLVPEEKLSAFEKEWETGEISDDWSDMFVWAVWKDNAVLSIEFQEVSDNEP